jgi:hypothetical protein
MERNSSRPGGRNRKAQKTLARQNAAQTIETLNKSLKNEGELSRRRRARGSLNEKAEVAEKKKPAKE